MSPDRPPKICIYPGCNRPAVPPHVLGGPQPSFCELEEHNALSAHLERQRRSRQDADPEPGHPADQPHQPFPLQEVPDDGQ